MIVALAGGVGAARFLRGLMTVVDPAEVTIVANTGDDTVRHGLRVSPDLDTLVYTLAGAIDGERGWGLEGETWAAMDALARYGYDLGWFRLGDRDLATHLYRTTRLASGATLSGVTAEIAVSWNVAARILPMTNDQVETRLRLAEHPDAAEAEELEFQEYFVHRSHSVEVDAIRFAGATEAQTAPGVLEALETAQRIVICPSNPLVSIAPILAVGEVEATVAERRSDVVAISPIVAGAAVKGPAARLMSEMGHEVSVVGIARLYAHLAATLVIDTADAALAGAVESEGLTCVVAPTIMTTVRDAAALARVVLRVE